MAELLVKTVLDYYIMVKNKNYSVDLIAKHLVIMVLFYHKKDNN